MSSAQLKTNSRTFLNEYLNQNQSSFRQKASVAANKITFNTNSFKISHRKGLTLQTDLTNESNSDYTVIQKQDSSFENSTTKNPEIPPSDVDDRYNYAFSRPLEPATTSSKKTKQSSSSAKLSHEEAFLKKLFPNPKKNTTQSNSNIFDNIENKRAFKSNRTLKVDTDVVQSNSNIKREANDSYQTLPKSALANATWANSLIIHPASTQGSKSSLINYQSLFPKQAETSPEKDLMLSRSRREVLIKTYNPKKAKQRPQSTSQKFLSQSKSSSHADFETVFNDAKRVGHSPDVARLPSYEDKKAQYQLKRNDKGSFELAAPKDTFNQILRGSARVPNHQLREIQSSLKGIPISTHSSQKEKKIKKPSKVSQGKPFISIIDHQQQQQPQQVQDPNSALADLVSNNNGLLDSKSQADEIKPFVVEKSSKANEGKKGAATETKQDAASARDKSGSDSEEQKISHSQRGQRLNNSSGPAAEKRKTRIRIQGTSPQKERSVETQGKSLNKKAPEPISCAYYMDNLRKHWINFNDEDDFCRLYRGHFCQIFQETSISKFIRPTELSILEKKKVFLEKRESHKDKKTLILDLDETLIHCNSFTDLPADVSLPITLNDGNTVRAGINIRPYAVEFLKEMSQHYEIIVFTASHSCYANVILDYLDPNKEYIHHRLFRDSCISLKEGIHVKDLRILRDRNLSDVVIVDNSANSFAFQVQNGIPIIPYYDNKADRELIDLMDYLKLIYPEPDLRMANSRFFKLKSYIKHPTPKDVLDKVIFKGF